MVAKVYPRLAPTRTIGNGKRIYERGSHLTRTLAKSRRSPHLFAALFALVASDAGGETITGARYAAPVDRYGHFALGRPHEYARVTATTDAGRSLGLQLPEEEVFEDLAPRLVRLAAGEPEAILAIVSGRSSGSRLVLIQLDGDRLVMSAQSPAIGVPMRWLNPVGVADLDGDGRAHRREDAASDS